MHTTQLFPSFLVETIFSPTFGDIAKISVPVNHTKNADDQLPNELFSWRYILNIATYFEIFRKADWMF
jgi:hypothetical protein